MRTSAPQSTLRSAPWPRLAWLKASTRNRTTVVALTSRLSAGEGAGGKTRWFSRGNLRANSRKRSEANSFWRVLSFRVCPANTSRPPQNVRSHARTVVPLFAGPLQQSCLQRLRRSRPDRQDRLSELVRDFIRRQSTRPGFDVGLQHSRPERGQAIVEHICRLLARVAVPLVGRGTVEKAGLRVRHAQSLGSSTGSQRPPLGVACPDSLQVRQQSAGHRGQAWSHDSRIGMVKSQPPWQ
jgi:hypothetical protein